MDRCTPMALVTLKMLILSTLAAGAARAAEPLLLDTHVHLNGRFEKAIWDQKGVDPTTEGEYRAELKSALDRSGARMNFVITPTFAVRPGFKVGAAELKRVNEVASRALALESSRARGLCGIPILREDALEIAGHCLALPGMIGAKVREFPLEGDVLKRFEGLLRQVADRNGVVLAHFDYGRDTTGIAGRAGSAETLLRVMASQPRATLIIAHAGTRSEIGLDGIARIGKHYRENPGVPRNLYLETSFAWEQSGADAYPNPDSAFRSEWAKTAAILNSWREFGLDWVLYGSDIMLPEGPEPGPWASDQLKPAEKNTILRLNARRLLDQLTLVPATNP